MADVEARVELTRLMDFYGPLLTEHRREVMQLYCEEDLSLAEIAEQLEITRQGVSDAIQKAKRQLSDYEKKLGLAARYMAVEIQAESCLKALENFKRGAAGQDALDTAIQAIENILKIER